MLPLLRPFAPPARWVLRFAHFKKTNKSGLNTIIEENAIPFELWLNHASLQGHVDGQLDRSEAPLTLTFIPGATPEELFAQCDADKVTRVYHGLLHGHDEIAGFFEDMGLYGGGQRTKARQSDLNVLMDKGRPSKIFRDQDRGYGKDLFALYRQTRDGTKPHKVQLLQISGINARDADRILRDDDVIAASLATRERYLFFTAPVMNPYALPPAHVQLPTEVLDEHGEPLQDRAGFRRDLLPRRGDCVQGMKRCYHFVHGLPNQELRFTDSGLEKFRCFDAWNWRLAGYVQYVDDQLAAELRQVQRHHALRCAGRLSLRVLLGLVPDDATVDNTRITAEIVDQAALTLASVLGGFAVGFRGVSAAPGAAALRREGAQKRTFRTPFVRFLPGVASSLRSLAGVDAASLPPLRPQADGEVDATLFCQVLAPAFVHMLCEEQVPLDPVAEAARQLNAAILGLMREALTWPGCAFVSKGMVTRKLNQADVGQAQLHRGWSKAQGHSNAARSEWWLQHVAAGLARMGLGSLLQASDGQRYVKPTALELSDSHTVALLQTHLQLSPDAVARSCTKHGSVKSDRSILPTPATPAALASLAAPVAPAAPEPAPAVAAVPLLPVISKAPGTPNVCSSPLPTLLDPPSGVVPASGDATASVGEVALTPAESAETAVIFDPYADEGVLRTLHLTGGTDQLALNNLRNIFCMVALRAQTPTHLAAYMSLDQRVEAEESDILARLRELLHGGRFSDEDPVFLLSGPWVS